MHLHQWKWRDQPSRISAHHDVKESCNYCVTVDINSSTTVSQFVAEDIEYVSKQYCQIHKAFTQSN